MATAKRTGAPKRPSTTKPATAASTVRSTRATKATKATKTATTKKRATSKKAGAVRGTMTAAHKRALADGREAALHVRRYLDALETHRPRRGRQRTPASVRKQLADVESQWGEASGLKRVELAQKRIDLRAVLAGLDTKVDLSDLRAGFVKHAKRYSASKGITYTAWRDAGVSPDDLRAAGISRRDG
jgi:CCR4-NOT transcriptional regulation complex NOT5 subunit